MYQGPSQPHPSYIPGPYFTPHAAHPEQLKHSQAAPGPPFEGVAPPAFLPVSRWRCCGQGR